MFFNVPSQPLPPLSNCFSPMNTLMKTINETLITNLYLVGLGGCIAPVLLWEISFVYYFEENGTEIYFNVWEILNFIRAFVGTFFFFLATLNNIDRI